MNRQEATERLVRHLSDEEIVVANLGAASWDLLRAKDRPQNFYGRGSMGMVSSIGLGLALAQPQRKVIILDGDGALLMNLGSLTTIAALRPPNLIHIVWDNERYDQTGGQGTHTGRGVNLAQMARGAGVPRVGEPSDEDEFERMFVEALEGQELWFILAKVAPGGTKAKLLPDAILAKYTFMRGIGTQ